MNYFERLNLILTKARVFKDASDDQEDILALLVAIFDQIAQADYDFGRTLRWPLLDISERHYEYFFAAQLFLVEKQLTSLLQMPTSPVSDLPPIPNDIGLLNQEFDRVLLNIQNTNTVGIGISSTTLPADAFTAEYREQLFSMLIQSAQYSGSLYQMSEDEAWTTMMMLTVARSLALALDRLDWFYGVTAVIAEKLNASSEYQLSRDFAEDILAASIRDKRPEWGYFVSFKVYNGQHNPNQALINLNILLACTRRRADLTSPLFIRLLIEIQRFFRNIRHDRGGAKLHEILVTRFQLTDTEMFDATNVYLLAQTMALNPDVVVRAYEYVSLNREFIFREGPSVAVPLLNTLQYIIWAFRDHPEIGLLDNYVLALERVIGEKEAQRIRGRVFGEFEPLKDLYVTEINALQKTRNTDDLVSESHNAMVLASRLITLAESTQDPNSFLLAMIIKADMSWVFQERDSKDKYRVLERDPLSNAIVFQSHSNYDDIIRSNFPVVDGCAYLWLGEADRRLFTLWLSSRGYSRISIAPFWDLRAMDDWLEKSFLDLRFDDTILVHGQVTQYLEEDQRRDLQSVQDTLSFARVPTEPSSSILLVKDITVSPFPHNLILDCNGEFLSRTRPITCIQSTEWFLERVKKHSLLKDDFSISMWLPTDGGDFELNYLFAKLNASIDEFKITSYNTLIPTKPMEGDINILVAHGAQDISVFHSFYPNENTSVVDLDNVIGKGVVAILFVCHSGSIARALFRNKMLSIIREFFDNDYHAVIAPFWSLHTSIPPIWLPVFLKALLAGQTISEAVFAANSCIYESNKNPGAWACLHLYGNPWLSANSFIVNPPA
jgi:hypothetical protein